MRAWASPGGLWRATFFAGRLTLMAPWALIASCAAQEREGGPVDRCPAACVAPLVCALPSSPTCVDPRWAAWPMPNGPTDVAAGAPNPLGYAVNGDGTVTDLVTGLMWQRVVSPTQVSWSEAAAVCAALTLAGHDDWRVPAEIELISLVDSSASSGAMIDPAAFPVTPAGYFWSSLPMADASPNAWLVDFITGSAYDSAVDGPNYVRCVRRASVPLGRYTLTAETVYDANTKLTWQRSVPATMVAMNGAATYCAGPEAAALGGAGWRVPTGKELLTLVDFSVAPPGPTIDAAAFPDTPGAFFWSSTALASPVPGVLFVDFAYGHATNYAVGPTSHVRCVR
jgi:hypothetical protein